jgi:hypothetical protein
MLFVRALVPLAFLVGMGMCASVDRAKEEAFIGKRRAWWAFQKPVRPPAPALQDAWIKTPIDAFILKSLKDKQLTPSAPLNKEQLIRRVTLDLTGLPPLTADVNKFVADKTPNAYEKVVDRLLASQQYGERWGQRWLDVVRYADTNGYELDAFRPHAWRYRDYVVDSFNSDKPYDRFILEQIAGDELFPSNKEALIATGFHRAGPIHLVSGNQDVEMNRQEVLTEFVSGVGTTFMGITIGCAKCHNHKFDPILQADYYRLQAIFSSTEGKDIEIATDEDRDRRKREMEEYKAQLEPVKKAIEAIEKPYREGLKEAKRAKLEPELKAVLEIPKEKRTQDQQKLARAAMSQIGVSWDEVLAAVSPADKERRAVLRKQMHEIELTQPDPLPTAYAVANAGGAPTIHILKIGDPKHKLEPVDPGLPSVLSEENGQVTSEPCSRRSALAKWLASPENPLTARVMANRVWQLRMGTGLVRTPNDFGSLGERPTNRELLDWLATELVERGWSVKALDRMIVTSSVYQQSATDDPAKSEIDSDNKLYWRANRRRMEAEMLRDNILAVSGSLNARMGGKPVRVPIEREIYDLIFTEDEPDNLWPLLPDRKEHNRRSIYLLNKRTVRLPMLANFDQPDAMTSCPVRPASTHALQALSLMNSDFMAEQATAFASRLEKECGPDRSCAVRAAYRDALAREPRQAEAAMAKEFFAGGAPLSDFCLALLNRNEFVYLP